MKFLKENFMSILVLALVLVLFIQRCTESRDVQENRIVTIKDTTIYIHDTVHTSKPVFITGKRDTIKEKEIWYETPTDLGTLERKFDTLRQMFLAVNTFTDTTTFDSSSVVVTSKIQNNELVESTYQWKLEYPTVTVNNYIPPKLKNQIYIGGQLIGNPASLISGVNANVLVKNKKDQIFGAGVGTDFKSNIIYNVQSYWKIKLKK